MPRGGNRMSDTVKLDNLITSARLSGRIDLLMEMKEWLDGKIVAAEKANDQMRANLNAPEAVGVADDDSQLEWHR